jgi:transcriptional regulator with XRE-family HTH domain
MAGEPTEEELGRRIRVARTDSNLSQQRLAEAIGSDQSVISRLEAGKDVSTFLLARIAKVTGKDIGFFLAAEVTSETDVFLRRGDATEPGIVGAVEDMRRLIEDHERLAGLPR